MNRLAEFLSIEASRPMAWGEHDCGLWLADWYAFATGDEDPAKHLRATYASEAQCIERLGTVAVLRQVRAITRRLGLHRTRDPVAGDIGALAFSIGDKRFAVGAICVGSGWTVLGSNGLTKYPHDAVRVIAAWRVPQHAGNRSG